MFSAAAPGGAAVLMAACNCRAAGTVHRAEQLLPSQRLANCHAAAVSYTHLTLPTMLMV